MNSSTISNRSYQFMSRFLSTALRTFSKMRNVEIKAKVRDVKALLEKAKELSGDPKCTEIIQHDIFYKTENGRLKLRIYKDKTSELVYYERPDEEGPKLSSYDKAGLDINGTKQMQVVLKRALGITVEVKKVRQLFMVGQTRVHVDNVEGLGDFMELEVMLNPDETVEQGIKIADDLMEKLGISKEDLISGAYADFLLKK